MEVISNFFKRLWNLLKDFIYFVGDNWLAITLIIIACMIVYLLFNIAYIPGLIKKAAFVIDVQMLKENESYEESKKDWLTLTSTRVSEGSPAKAEPEGPETSLIDLFEEGGD